MAVDKDPRACYFKQVHLRPLYPHGTDPEAAGDRLRRKKPMIIDAIKNGIVIDHIAGRPRPWSSTRYLRPGRSCTATVAHSQERRQRQAGAARTFIKVDRGASTWIGTCIGYVDPDGSPSTSSPTAASAEKRHPKLPETIYRRDSSCKNPRCITSVEQELAQVFKLTDPENRRLPLHLLRYKSGISVSVAKYILPRS